MFIALEGVWSQESRWAPRPSPDELDSCFLILHHRVYFLPLCHVWVRLRDVWVIACDETLWLAQEIRGQHENEASHVCPRSLRRLMNLLKGCLHMYWAVHPYYHTYRPRDHLDIVNDSLGETWETRTRARYESQAQQLYRSFTYPSQTSWSTSYHVQMHMYICHTWPDNRCGKSSSKNFLLLWHINHRLNARRATNLSYLRE